MELAKILRTRCLKMLNEGFLEEYLSFRTRLESLSNYSPALENELLFPIGYKQADKLRQDCSNLSSKDPKSFDKAFKQFFREFSGATRHYATYQQAYYKKHLAEFQNILLTDDTVSACLEQILAKYQGPPDESQPEAQDKDDNSEETIPRSKAKSKLNEIRRQEWKLLDEFDDLDSVEEGTSNEATEAVIASARRLFVG